MTLPEYRGALGPIPESWLPKGVPKPAKKGEVPECVQGEASLPRLWTPYGWMLHRQQQRST